MRQRHPDETRDWGVPQSEVAHVRPSNGVGEVTGERRRTSSLGVVKSVGVAVGAQPQVEEGGAGG